MGIAGLLWCFALFPSVFPIPVNRGTILITTTITTPPPQQRAVVVGGSILITIAGNEESRVVVPSERRSLTVTSTIAAATTAIDAANTTTVRRLNQPPFVRCLFHPPILPPNICQHVLLRNSTFNSSSSIYLVNMWLFVFSLTCAIYYGN